MPRRKSQQQQESQTELSEDQLILSPLTVPEAQRNDYWNALLEDRDQLRAALATMEFFPLLAAIPKALWEKRLLVYVYRTAPKVKNQAGDKSYIAKIPHPFDEEFIKENHGGGSYLCYLNLDSKEQLKQITFSVDGPAKLLQGQTLLDSNGNVIPIGVQPTPAQSEVAQVVAATSDASRAGIEVLAKGTEAAIELQQRVFEKIAGVNGNNTTDRLLEYLLKRDDKPREDPTVLALTLMDKLDSIVQRRMPQEKDENPKDNTPLSETLAVVSELTGGKTIPELLNAGRGGRDDSWVGIAIGAGAKLIENLPTILGQIFQNQERQFQRQLILAQARGALPPANGASAPPTTDAPGPGRVAAPPASPFIVPATAATQVLPTAAAPGAQFATVDNPADQVAGMVSLIVKKFGEGFNGSAVAQALDVLYPDLLEMIAPTVMHEQEMRKFVLSIPELAALSTSPATSQNWKEFEADFVEFVRSELSDDIAGNGDQKKPVMPAASA